MLTLPRKNIDKQAPLRDMIRLVTEITEPEVYSMDLHTALRKEVPAINHTLSFVEKTRLTSLIGWARYEMPCPDLLYLSFLGYAPNPDLHPYNRHFLNVLQSRMYQLGFPEQGTDWLSKEKVDGKFKISINPKRGFVIPSGVILEIEVPKKEKYAEEMMQIVSSPKRAYRNYLLSDSQPLSTQVSSSEQSPGS